MADWTNLPNTAVGVGGLPSGTTVTALRDNPIAIAEGAAGAPRVQAVALAGVRQPLLTATGNSYVTLTNLDRYKSVQLVCAFVADAAADRFIQLNLSTNNGASWGASVSVGMSDRTFYTGFTVTVGMQDGVLMSAGLPGGSQFGQLGSGNYNALRIRQATSSLSGNILQVVPYFWEDKV